MIILNNVKNLILQLYNSFLIVSVLINAKSLQQLFIHSDSYFLIINSLSALLFSMNLSDSSESAIFTDFSSSSVMRILISLLQQFSASQYLLTCSFFFFKSKKSALLKAVNILFNDLKNHSESFLSLQCIIQMSLKYTIYNIVLYLFIHVAVTCVFFLQHSLVKCSEILQLKHFSFFFSFALCDTFLGSLY